MRTRRATKDAVETGADDDDDGEREEVSDDDVGSRAILRAPFSRRLGLALALRSHVLKTSPELMRCCLSPARRRQSTLEEEEGWFVVGVTCAFDGTPTSPALRHPPPRKRLSLATRYDAKQTGGSAATRCSQLSATTGGNEHLRH